MIHDGAWVLPEDAKTREDFEWIAEEIEERGGSALLWEARSLPSGQDSLVIERFRGEAEERYDAITKSAEQLAHVAEKATKSQLVEKAIQQLRGLERTLRRERRRDYFRASGRQEAELAVRTALEDVRSRTENKATARRSHAMGN